ncbi:hypothetical protein ENBRE01_0883 [Enteropsectra breve]|nr:hypothetical protein ENBRE01_0883 [Enteropsectra breve]
MEANNGKPSADVAFTLAFGSGCIILIIALIYWTKKYFYRKRANGASTIASFLYSNKEVEDFVVNDVFFPYSNCTTGLQAAGILKKRHNDLSKISSDEASRVDDLINYVYRYKWNHGFRLYPVFHLLLEENRKISPFEDMAVVYQKKLYCPKTEMEVEDNCILRPIATLYLKPTDIDSSNIINISQCFETTKQLCTQCNSYFHREDVITSLSVSYEYLIVEVIAAKNYSNSALEFKQSYSILNERDGKKLTFNYNVVSILFVKINMFGPSEWIYTLNEQQPLKFSNVTKNDVFYLMMKK